MACALFISGPHGGGKSTLIERLVASGGPFLENDFDIDFTVDFPNLGSLTHFERCLIRLYHRLFILGYAEALAGEHPDSCVVTNRTIYDSEAYIHVYRDLGWITAAEFRKLNVVLQRAFLQRPRAVVLNPPVAVILQRLQKRRSARARSARDEVFAKEDAEAFIRLLRAYFEKFQHDDRILYLEDDRNDVIPRIAAWALPHGR